MGEFCNKEIYEDTGFDTIRGCDTFKIIFINSKWDKYNKNNNCPYFKKSLFRKLRDKKYCTDCKYWAYWDGGYV